MYWNNKYHPNNAEDFIYHQKIIHRLENLIIKGDFPHTILSGRPSSGKKTILRFILKAIYGDEVNNIRIVNEERSIKVGESSKINVDITTLISPYHIQITPSDVEHKDRHIVQDMIKNMASQPLSLNHTFNVLVLLELENMTREAQQALRRTMEKYSSSCRLLMVTENISKVIDPVRSRCVVIRVPKPSLNDMKSVLFNIAEKEGFELAEDFCEKIIRESDFNMNRSVKALEYAFKKQFPFDMANEIFRPEWEKKLKEICQKLLVEKFDLKKMEKIRGELNKLLISGISSIDIIRFVINELMHLLNENNELLGKIVDLSYEYDSRVVKESKVVSKTYSLEAFILAIARVLKTE